jgi:hypothetical protein
MRTDEEIALAEASRLCQEFADLYRDAAELAEKPGVRELMAKLVEEHERVRAGIDERLRALDDGPLSPDPELEGLKKLATRVKKMFAPDERAVLLDEGIEHENQLLAHVRDALKLDLSPPTRARLQDAERTAEAALRLLSQERTAHS